MRHRYQAGETVYAIDLERHGESYRAVIDGENFDLSVLALQDGEITLMFEGRPVTLYFATHEGNKWVSLGGCTYILEKPTPGSKRRGTDASAEGIVRAPMPAQVRALYVAEGESVEKGDTLLLLEAMKMEIRIQAPAAGVVKRILAGLGETVARDEVVVEIGEAT